MRRKQTSVLLIPTLLATNVLMACNIPVFRYALERWQPDQLELVVVHNDAFDANELDTLLKANNSAANLKLVMINGELNSETRYPSLRRKFKENVGKNDTLVALQGKHPRGEFTIWSGSVSDFKTSNLLSSPARTKIGERLMAGHAIVWLIVEAKDSSKTEEVVQLLAKANKELEKKIELPEGIGLPGSELFADVPLLLKFSTVRIARDSEEETFLLSLAKGFQPEEFESGQSMVIPIFGRGRALEVIPGNRLSSPLVRDLTMFLCGACSCQVKDQNPGFDLLFNRDWEAELYGEDGERPPVADSISPEQRQSPVLLQIPPGRKR